jgi:hypothetical protein
MSVDYFFDGLMVMGPRPSSNGNSAYEYAAEGGYTGTEEEFGLRLAALLNDGISASVDTHSNRIILAGSLVPGTYTAYYEVNGELVEIGELTLGSVTPDPVTYTVKWCNYDGTVLETDTVTEGETPVYNSATPARAADSQYTYTFKGWDKTVIAAVADATYTAVYEQTAVEPEPAEPKNFVVYDKDNTTAENTTIWTNQARFNSGGSVVADTSATYGVAVVSNFISVQNGDTVYYEGFYTPGKSSWLGDTSKNPVKYGALSVIQTSGHIKDLSEADAGDRSGHFTISHDDVKYLRLGGFVRDTDTPVIRIMRGGKWLTGEEETA